MNKTLKLEKRGCDFYANDPRHLQEVSDIGNFRVGCYDMSIEGKDGRKYLVEFSHWERYAYRTTHKVTGRELKHPIRELVNPNALHLDTQYDVMTESGIPLSYRNLDLEHRIHDMNLDYTKAGILEAVNHISKDTYTDIEFI